MNAFRLAGVIVLMMISTLAGLAVLGFVLIATLMKRERKNEGTTFRSRRAYERHLQRVELDLISAA